MMTDVITDVTRRSAVRLSARHARSTMALLPAAIFANPHAPENWIARSTSPGVREAASAYYTAIDASTKRQARALESGVPAARVVRLTGAHDIFLPNEADTAREMAAFLLNLK